jgi:predicted phosphodiesterase
MRLTERADIRIVNVTSGSHSCKLIEQEVCSAPSEAKGQVLLLFVKADSQLHADARRLTQTVTTMTTISIISDIHGNLAALEAVAEDIKVRGIGQVVNLGDSLSGPLLPLETARFLMASGWLSLAGNHERQILNLRSGRGGPSDQYAASQLGDKEFVWLRSLTHTMQLGNEVFLCHGTPRSDCEYFLDTVDGSFVRLASSSEINERLSGEQSAVVACGHTHIPRSVRTATGQLLVNPGSVGLPAYSDDQPTPHVVETGSTDACYAILSKGEDGWLVQHVSLPYDNKTMASLARKRGRPDWEQALLTGYAK